MPDVVDADVVGVAAAVNVWLVAVAARFPWRARMFRWMARRPFGLRCLLWAIQGA